MASPSSVSQSASTLTSPPQYRSIGVVLAIGSGVLIGTSFVFKKKGLLSSQKGHAAGEGVAYLKSPMWWTGMTIMILGELCNFAAYAFVEAIIVTPMGALSVVISSILSHIFLREKLSLFGWISSAQCLLGASILALNGPQEQSVSTIEGFKHLFLAPGFLVYGALVIASAAILAFWAAPKWGERSMMPYLGVCSLIGGLSVSCTQGLGASIVTSIRGENQFKNWFIYFLLVFVAATLLTEVYYLNVALAKFNTAMVTPTYYVTFTFCTLVTSVILYQGLKASASQIMTVVLAFLVICTGIMILQMSKVDPRMLTNVDEHTTMLLEVAKQEVEPCAAQVLEDRAATLHSRRSRASRLPTVTGRSMAPFSQDEEQAIDLELAEQPSADIIPHLLSANDAHHIIARTEQPGLDSLRGTFGAIGTIIRARRRAQAASSASIARSRLSRSSVGPSNRSTSRGRDLPFATSQPAAAGGGLGWIWGWRRRDATMSGHAGGSGFWRGHDEDIIPEGDAEKGEEIVQILPSSANDVDVDVDGKLRTPQPFRSGLSQSYRQLGSRVQLANDVEDVDVRHRVNASTMPPSFASAQRVHVGNIFGDLRRS